MAIGEAAMPGQRTEFAFDFIIGQLIESRQLFVFRAVFSFLATTLFLRGMTIRAAKTDGNPVWKLLGAPGEARLRYPRRRGVW